MKNRLEVICEYLLELRSLFLQKRVFGEVEYFFAEKLQNVEGVLTFSLRLAGSLTDVGDEVLPGYEPLLLHD